MKRLFLVSLFVVMGSMAAVFAQQKDSANLQMLHRTDHERFYAYPNGWGGTPAAATKDLDRVMEIYKDRPGYFRHAYVRIVNISRTQYEADGCVSFYAPDAKLPVQVKGLRP